MNLMKTATEEIIQRQKADFRDEYQGKSAAYLGIIAAVQRASLYTPASNNNADIRRKWERLLEALVEKYKTKQQDEKTFKEDILSLKDAMNQAFPPEQRRFDNGKDGYDDEFRIAHAQKSLSICLKHLWCRGELGNNIPPLCPVDGILLKAAHNYDSWTKVNTMEEFESHIALLKQCAEGYDNLSCWELMTWKPQGRKAHGSKTSKKKGGLRKAGKTPKAIVVDSLKKGEKILDRTGSTLSGYRFTMGKRKLYVFAGEDREKSYCEIISSDGYYSDRETGLIKSQDCFEHISPESSRHYFICTFSKSENSVAKQLTERIKDEISKIFTGQ